MSHIHTVVYRDIVAIVFVPAVLKIESVNHQKSQPHVTIPDPPYFFLHCFLRNCQNVLLRKLTAGT